MTMTIFMRKFWRKWIVFALVIIKKLVIRVERHYSGITDEVPLGYSSTIAEIS
jgi:hypothetical protein